MKAGTMGFLAFCAIAALIEGIAVWCLNSKKPVGFFANVKEPPVVTDVKAYNKALFKLWTGFAVYIIIAGLPLLGAKQNSARSLLTVLLLPPGCIALAVTYMFKIENKYKVKK